MGTREVYEEKLRNGNLHHDPTLNPGLGSPRCPRCLSLLNPNSEKGEWTITSVLHDATAVAGSGIGGMLSTVHGLNTGLPYLQSRLKGPKWLPFVVGLPPLLIFSGASAAFGAVEGASHALNGALVRSTASMNWHILYMQGVSSTSMRISEEMQAVESIVELAEGEKMGKVGGRMG